MSQTRTAPPEAKSNPSGADRLRDNRRLAALARTGLMDSIEEEAFDRAARIATSALGVPVSLVSLVDDRRQFFKAQVGLQGDAAEARQTPLSHSFCQHVVSNDAPLVVRDAREDPLVRDNLAVPDLGVIAYLGVPIRDADGQPLGSFCAIDGKPRDWSEQDKSLLHDLGCMVETEIRLRHALDAQELLTKELNHRIKNLFAMLNGMISLTARHSHDVDTMATALTGRIKAMSFAHDLIRPALTNLVLDAKISRLHEVLDNLIKPHLGSGRDRLILDGDDFAIEPRSVAHLALLFHELATNAAKYGALSTEQGKLVVRWRRSAGGDVTFHWEEQGGPAVTQPPDRAGFGSRLIDMMVAHQLGGTMTSDWRLAGVQHQITLPATVFEPAIEP